MHVKLEKLLAKRGIQAEELTTEEKSQFDKWNGVMSNSELKVADIEQFCIKQKELIEGQFTNLDNSGEKNTKLVLLHSVYSKLARACVADKTERESLERYLNQLIDNA
jgi:hypothetical protein